LSSDGGLVIVFVFFLYVIRVFFGLSGGFLYFLPPPKSFVEDSFVFRRIWILRLVRGTLLHPGVGGRKGVAWILLFLLEKNSGCCFLCTLCLRNCLTSSDYHPCISATIARELKFSVTEMYI